MMLNESYLRRFVKKNYKKIKFIDVGNSRDWNLSSCYWRKSVGFNPAFFEIKEKLGAEPIACVQFLNGEILTFTCKRTTIKENWDLFWNKNKSKNEITPFEHQPFSEMMSRTLYRHTEN
jgi:hypothetical protein